MRVKARAFQPVPQEEGVLMPLKGVRADETRAKLKAVLVISPKRPRAGRERLIGFIAGFRAGFDRDIRQRRRARFARLREGVRADRFPC